MLRKALRHTPSSHSPSFGWVGTVAALFVGLALSPSPAAAQVKAAAQARMQLLNTQAMDHYDGLEFEEAKKKLLEALSLAEQASVKRGGELATTYINLGIVYGAGFNNRIKAIEAFTKALQASRTARVDPARATPALDEMYRAAQDNVARQPPEPEAGVRHVPLTRGIQGRRLLVRAAVTEVPDEVEVLLYYRRRDGGRYIRTRMRPRGSGVYAVTIPGRRVRAPSLQYYIEVRDDAGERIAGAGSSDDPFKVRVRRRRGYGRKTISISVMAGTGGGVVFGGSSESLHPRVGGALGNVEIKPGAAMSPMHVAAEVGYHLTPLWRLGALARIQVLTLLDGVSITTPNPISVLGIARAKRYFALGTSQPYLSFGAGGGNLRHRIALGDYDPNEDPLGTLTPNNIVDARVSGYAVLAFGGGIDVMFTDNFGMVADALGMILIPKFGAHLDINLGLLVSF